MVYLDRSILIFVVLALLRLANVDAFVVTTKRAGGEIKQAAQAFVTSQYYSSSVVAPPLARVPTHQWSSADGTSEQQEETVIEFALTMNRVCLLMILISYLPWPKADPDDIPDDYQSDEGRKTYERLKAFVEPLQDKIDNFTDGVTQQELSDLLFSERPQSALLLEYMQHAAKKDETKWSGELMKQRGVLENLRPRKDDGNLVYIRPEGRDPNKVFGIVANHKLKRITLVFRGSQNLGDWITNIQAAMKYEQMNDLQVGIHAGFFERLTEPDEVLGIVTLYKLVSERIRAAVPSDAKGSYSLIVTGHSLGGAMATICGLLLARDKEIADAFLGPVTIVSLAAPRVGNHNFRRVHQHLEKSGRLCHLRCMNDDDIVPTIPYKNLFGKGAYTHVGLRWVLHNHTDNEAEVSMAYPDVAEFNPPVSLWGKASNHYTWIYRDRLLSLLKQGEHPDLQLPIDKLFAKYLGPVSDPL